MCVCNTLFISSAVPSRCKSPNSCFSFIFLRPLLRSAAASITFPFHVPPSFRSSLLCTHTVTNDPASRASRLHALVMDRGNSVEANVAEQKAGEDDVLTVVPPPLLSRLSSLILTLRWLSPLLLVIHFS
jgi:hypothetical protein